MTAAPDLAARPPAQDPPAVAPAATPDPRFGGVSTAALHRELRARKLASPSRDVRANAGSATGRYHETASVLGMARRGLRALGKRAEAGGVDVEMLPAVRDLADEAERVFKDIAWQVHRKGYSWQEIADVLGTGKPAAWRRFRGGGRNDRAGSD